MNCDEVLDKSGMFVGVVPSVLLFCVSAGAVFVWVFAIFTVAFQPSA